ncbi:hypothetical protein, partial [Stieleria sp.]|uniref:hypothetical protein n=1 Tax=Stieleria sp. TaxID=2795976 RepID=UPI00356B4FF9
KSRRSSLIATRMDVTTNAKHSANIEAIKTQTMVAPSWDSLFTDANGYGCIFHANFDVAVG